MCIVIELHVIGFPIVIRYNNRGNQANLSVIFDTDKWKCVDIGLHFIGFPIVIGFSNHCGQPKLSVILIPIGDWFWLY